MPDLLAAPQTAGLAPQNDSATPGDTSPTPRPPVAVNRLTGLFQGESDFYNALGPAADQVRSQIDAQPNPVQERQRIANTAFLADCFKLSAREVANQYDTLRQSYARQAFPNVPAVHDEGVFFSAVQDKLQKEAQERELMGELNRQLFVAAAAGKDFKTAWAETTAAGPGVVAKNRADLFNAWAIDRWGKNQEAVKRIGPELATVTRYFRAKRTGSDGEFDVDQLRQASVNLLVNLSEEDRAMVMSLAASEAKATSDQKERSGFQATIDTLAEGIGHPLQEALASLYHTTEAVFGYNDQERRARAPAMVTQQLERMASGEVDPVKVDNFLGQQALNFTREAPKILAASNPVGLAINYFALKQNARDALQAQGATAGAAEATAALQAIPQAAAYYAGSNLIFRGRIPFAVNPLQMTAKNVAASIAKTFAVEAGLQFAVNEATGLASVGIQNLAAEVDHSIPGVGMKELIEQQGHQAPELITQAIIGGLIGTGVATYHNAAAGRSFLQRSVLMDQLGFKPEHIDAVLEAKTYEQAETAFKQGFEERTPPPPPPEPLPQPSVEPLGKRFLVAEGVGDPVEQYQVRMPGEDRGVTMTAEELAAAGIPEPSQAMRQIAEVGRTNAQEFATLMRAQPKGLTRYAYEVGRALTNRSEVNALVANMEDATAQLQQAMAKAKGGDMDAMNDAMLLSTKAQFFREAYEAALGVGSAGEHLSATEAGYRANIVRDPETGSYTVQAVDGAPPVTAATPEGAAMVAEAQRTEAAQKAATSPPEPSPANDDGRALPPRITALNKEAITALRALFNMDELPAPQRERWTQLMDEAKRTNAHERAEQTALEVVGSKRPPTASEHAAMLLRSAELQNQYEAKTAEIADAFVAGDAERAKALKAVADNLQERLDTLTEASDLGGTEAGRALSARRMRLNRDDYSLAKVAQRLRTAKQGNITAEEQVLLKEITDDMVAQQQILAEQRAKLIETDIENSRLRAETFVNEGRSRRRAGASRDAAARRAGYKRELMKLGVRVNDITSIVPLSYEYSRLVAKIAETHIEEGIASLAELTNKLKADIPDLSDQDIFQALGRQTKKQAKKIETEVQRRVKDLREQAALWAKINAALDRQTPEGTPINRKQQHKILRDTLAELRRQSNKTTFNDEALARVQAKISEVQKFLETGQRPTPKSEAAGESPELTKARNTLKELQQEMGATDTLAELEAALTDAMPKEGEGKTQGPPTEQQVKLNALREKIADVRGQIDAAQVDPAAVNAERLARLQRLAADLEAQIEGGFRPLREPKSGVADDATVEATRRQVRELERLMKTQDSIADLEEQLRTGEYKVSAPEQRILTNARIEQALIKQRHLRRKIDELIEANRKRTKTELAIESLLIPRTLLATADLSATLRQGLLLSAPRPGAAARGILASIKAALNEESADAAAVAFENRPLWMEGEKAGLFLSEAGGILKAREEHFIGEFANRIWGLRRIVRASDRAMVTTLNTLRVAAFDGFVKAHPEATAEQKKAFARYVNAASGRGNVKWSPSTVKTLNAAFFAPRYAVSRFQALYSPIKNWNDPIVRNAILKDFGALLGTGMTVLALASWAGADVTLDPTDSDFGKIVVDDTRIDIWGGLQQPARLMLAVPVALLNRTEIAEFEKEVNPIEAALQFTGYKLSPALTIPNTLLTGKNMIGQEQDAWETAWRSITPLNVQETWDVWDNTGEVDRTAAAAALGFVGVGVSEQGRR